MTNENEMLSKIQGLKNTTQKPVVKQDWSPKVGEMVIAYYIPELDRANPWYKAKLLAIQEDAYIVQYLDADLPIEKTPLIAQYVGKAKAHGKVAPSKGWKTIEKFTEKQHAIDWTKANVPIQREGWLIK